MRRILEEFYFGNCNPSGERTVNNAQLDQALSIFSQREEQLTSLLDGKEKKLFLDLVNASDAISAATVMEAYSSGHQMGAQMMLAVAAL